MISQSNAPPPLIYETAPADFRPSAHVSGCYFELNGQILLLESSPIKEEAGRYGIPAGKIEMGELPIDGAIRELFEETGIKITQNDLQLISTYYMIKPHIQYTFHVYKVLLDENPTIKLNSENSSFIWASEDDLQTLPLLNGAKEVLERVKKTL